MAHAPEHEPHKRKRDLDDDGNQPAHHHQPTTREPAGPESVINFVPRNNTQVLGLIPGDVDTFGDISYLIGEYEGVLDRNESLAANLGAKLTGPRFLRGIERFFDGPIKTNSSLPYVHQITWLDVVTFAKSNPNAFSLVPLPNGTRCCRFMYQGMQVEITEDDWRLISSGALDKFPLEHTFEEDEAAEVATLEILEQRTSILHKKAEEIAGRARVLHHKLVIRKADVGRRRQQQLHDDGITAGAGSSSSSGFHAINHMPRAAAAPSHDGSPYDIHAELLQQFSMAAMQQNFPPPGPPPGYQLQPSSGTSMPVAGGSPLEAPPYQPLPSTTYPAEATAPSASTPAPAPASAPAPAAPAPAAAATVSPTATSSPASTPAPKTKSAASSQVVLPGDPATEVHRALVLQKTDTLNKGEIIFPPCDRCRRLRLQCVKHLTACRGCTKKHARCNWRNVTDAEAAILRHELDAMQRDPAYISSGVFSSTPRSEVNNLSRPASGSEAGSGGTPMNYGRVDLGLVMSGPVLGPSPVLAPPLAPPFAPPPLPLGAAEPQRKILPTTRLTRIEPIPTVPRDPPRTGQLASILSPPDYEPRPLATLPRLVSR